MNKKWYVLEFEGYNYDNLDSIYRILSEKFGLENIFYKTVDAKVLNNKKRTFITKKIPITFNYMFIRGENPAELLSKVKKLFSRVDMLKKVGSDEYEEVTDEEINNMKCDNEEETRIWKKNDLVKIKTGPYFDFLGTVMSVKKDSVKVKLIIFDKEFKIIFPKTDVELL
jgi:transcription antitermination factor NusG